MSYTANRPRRGEIWGVNLDPTQGHEQAGSRPALIVSDDALNAGPLDLVIVCPITGTNRGIPTHVPVVPPEGGLSKPSVIMVEQIRAVSITRLGRRFGTVTPETMDNVDQISRLVLGL